MSIAEERIKRLFELAERRSEEGEEDLADRYVEIAREISMGSQESIPAEFKKKFCSKCYRFLIPGKNCRVRTDSKAGKIVYTCEDCGKVERYGLEKQ